MQTLALIKIPNIINSGLGFQILITEPIKTSGVNKTQPCLHIPVFPENPKLCVASTLKNYLIRTREKRPKDCESLFITTQKPFRAANKQSLSRWVRQTIESAGVDTRIVKAHSTRHASTSAALRKGVSVDVIRQTAGWSQQSAVFVRFYNRPLSQAHALADAIILS